MRRTVTLLVCLAFATMTFANYANDVLKPWVGATVQELVSKWGYPKTANDAFQIDEETIIFTYRSFRMGIGGPMRCVVSFTSKKDVVTQWKYEGEHCPRYKRE